MELTFNATIIASDYRNDTGKLPRGIEDALKQFTPFDFITMFSDVVAVDGYAFTPNGRDESDELEAIYLFKVYKEDDDLFDWINGDREEPDYFELAISFS